MPKRIQLEVGQLVYFDALRTGGTRDRNVLGVVIAIVDQEATSAWFYSDGVKFFTFHVSEYKNYLIDSKSSFWV